MIKFNRLVHVWKYRHWSAHPLSFFYFVILPCYDNVKLEFQPYCSNASFLMRFNSVQLVHIICQILEMSNLISPLFQIYLNTKKLKCLTQLVSALFGINLENDTWTPIPSPFPRPPIDLILYMAIAGRVSTASGPFFYFSRGALPSSLS